MRFIVCLFLLFLASVPLPAQAQTANLAAPINRSSPGDTYQSFIAATNQVEVLYADYVADKTAAKVQLLRHHLQRIRQLMDLSAVPPSTRVKVGNAAIGYLYDILARLPPPDPASIPGRETAIEGDAAGEARLPLAWTIPGTDIQIAYVSDGQNGGNYLFTAESIASLPDYYAEIRDADVVNDRIYENFHDEQINAAGTFISDEFVRTLPEPLRRNYYDTPVWKILATFGVAASIIVVAVAWTWFAYRRSRRFTSLRRVWWRLTVPLVILALLFVGEWFVASELNPAGTFAARELMLVTVLRYVTAAWLVWLLIYFGIEMIILSPRIPDDSYDANLLRLASRIIAFISIGTILAYGADQVGIPALGLIAGLGVGGFAVALAAQSTLENLFGGISLFADRPFRVGDAISLGSHVATVERIGPRSSRLRARDGTLCAVPNADLAKAHIVNFSKRNICFLDQDIAVKADTDPERIGTLLQAARALLETRDLLEKNEGWPRLHVVGALPGRIQISLQARVLTTEYHMFLAEQELILLSMLALIHEHGIELAAPLMLAQEP